MTTRRIRITRHGVVKGRDLLPNPRNWRRHPPEQRSATTAVLDRLGYVDELKVVDTPDGLMLMDGHLRAEIGADDDVGTLVGGVDIALTLTDPPYGIGIVRGVEEGSGGRVGVPGVVEPRLYRPVHGDDKPFDPSPVLALRENQIIFGAGYFAQRLPEGTAWLCWDKGISGATTFSACELAWTSFPGRYRLYRHMWSGMVRAGSRDVELADRVHPTQKPVAVLEAILQDFSAEGDAICDPYIGSGSTLIACERTGRTCYAVEIEPPYCDVVIQRWEAYTGQKARLLP